MRGGRQGLLTDDMQLPKKLFSGEKKRCFHRLKKKGVLSHIGHAVGRRKNAIKKVQNAEKVRFGLTTQRINGTL
jgi:hypothetical protein